MAKDLGILNDFVWRPYQIQCFNAIHHHFKEKKWTKMLAVQATGTGKRIQAVYLSTKFRRTLFLAHREELIEQAYDDFVDVHGILNVGIIKGPKMESDKKIVIASPSTLHRRLDKIDPKAFDLVIADEAHHYMATTFLKCIDYFEPRLFVGMTATPFRLDGLPLSNIAQGIAFEYNIDQGIKDGFLAPLDALKVQTHIDISGVHRRAGDLAKNELSAKVDVAARNAMIAEKYVKHCDGRSAIAFCVDMQHCINLKDHFDRRNISNEILVSSDELTEDRKGTVARFKSGETKVLINIEIATEGFDFNDVGCLLMARPTQSLALYMQMIGRGTRLKSADYITRFHTNSCKVIDFVDNTGNHSLINTWELDRGKPAAEKVFVTEENRLKLLDAEKQRREAEIKTRVDKDQYIDLLKLPKFSINWNPDKMKEPATEAQIKFLIGLGIYEDGIEYTKAMASEAISNTEAYPWQKKKLREWGYDPTNATKGQFKKVEASIQYQTKFQMTDKEIDQAMDALKQLTKK